MPNRITIQDEMKNVREEPVSEGIRKHADKNRSADARDNPDQKNQILPQMAGRQPITIKLRLPVASNLKRLSLQRQLDGVEPHTMQDMVEQAIEQWLDANV